jgi:hypothetical protein
VNIRKTTTTVRTGARFLALVTLLGIAVSSTAVPSVYAEAKGGGINPDKPCYIPGSNLPYVTGEKATFSLGGEPAKEHTCQKDGTWTAIQVPDRWHWVASVGSGFLAP